MTWDSARNTSYAERCRNLAVEMQNNAEDEAVAGWMRALGTSGQAAPNDTVALRIGRALDRYCDSFAEDL